MWSCKGRFEATPAELTVAVAVATPVLAFLGVLLGQWVSRKGDKEADRWRRREETMRLLRWSVESATSENLVLAAAGLAVLDELVSAELLQPEDKDMVEAVVDVVTSAARAMAYAGLGDLDYDQAEILVAPEEGING